jgi:hypothetical protein
MMSDENAVHKSIADAYGGAQAVNSDSDQSPFDVLGYTVSFAINEDILRAKYFEKCREFRENPAMLEIVHRSYITIKDPLNRLNFLIADAESLATPSVSEQSTANQSENRVPNEALALYDELSALPREERGAFVSKIGALIQALNIQEAFERNDMQGLRAYRDQLSYYRKIIDIVRRMQ